jgi:glutathione S-transferase
LLPLAGVVNPAIWKTFAVAIPAVAALARVLDTHVARLAVPLFAAGAGPTLADIAFGLKVSYDRATERSSGPLPSW